MSEQTMLLMSSRSVKMLGLGALFFLLSCQSEDPIESKLPQETARYASVPADLFQADGDLEVTVWAQSPLFYNPTNMDIDAKGRIWVAESRHYRSAKPDPKGDRIMVVEDTDGDGKADQSHVFIQDPELTSPLGVAVIGNKVLVAQPPHMIMYTDVNDDAVFDPKVDKRENFLSALGAGIMTTVYTRSPLVRTDTGILILATRGRARLSINQAAPFASAPGTTAASISRAKTRCLTPGRRAMMGTSMSAVPPFG
jgi:hypothetical protein